MGKPQTAVIGSPSRKNSRQLICHHGVDMWGVGLGKTLSPHHLSRRRFVSTRGLGFPEDRRKPPSRIPKVFPVSAWSAPNLA